MSDTIFTNSESVEDYSKKAVIVAAGHAWPFYQKHKAYRCQENRSFQPTNYMGFYANQEVKEYFPSILGYVDNLNLQTDDLSTIDITMVNGLDQEVLRDKLRSLKAQLKPGQWNTKNKYVLLTDLEEEETFVNTNTIQNDKTSSTGKGIAFTQGHTYFSIDDLKGKKYTSELR